MRNSGVGGGDTGKSWTPTQRYADKENRNPSTETRDREGEGGGGQVQGDQDTEKATGRETERTGLGERDTLPCPCALSPLAVRGKPCYPWILNALPVPGLKHKLPTPTQAISGLESGAQARWGLKTSLPPLLCRAGKDMSDAGTDRSPGWALHTARPWVHMFLSPAVWTSSY